MQSQPAPRPACLPAASGLDMPTGGEGSNLPCHRFSSKLTMTVSTEPQRRLHFVLKDTQLLERPGSCRPDGQVLCGVRCPLGLDSPRLVLTVGRGGGMQQAFPSTSQAPAQVLCEPFRPGPSSVPGKGPFPLPRLATSHWLPFCFLVFKYPLFPCPPPSQPSLKELIWRAPLPRRQAPLSLFLSLRIWSA